MTYYTDLRDIGVFLKVIEVLDTEWGHKPDNYTKHDLDVMLETTGVSRGGVLTIPTIVLMPPPETAERIRPVTTASTKP
jgi:hypothetical protein